MISIPIICFTLNAVTLCGLPQPPYETNLQTVVAEYQRQRLHPPTKPANGDPDGPIDRAEES